MCVFSKIFALTVEFDLQMGVSSLVSLTSIRYEYMYLLSVIVVQASDKISVMCTLNQNSPPTM